MKRALAAIGRHVRAHLELYGVPLVYLACLVFLYRQIFFPGPRQHGFGWDAIESYWADLSYFADRVRHGDWPIWSLFDKAGGPDFAVPERGHYDPLNWLFVGWGAVVGQVSWWLIQAKMLSHHLLAGLAMHLYLRRRGVPVAAALVGGGAWMASAPMLIHKASSVLWPMVWVPLLWLAIDHAMKRPGWRRGALLGGALGLAGVAGSAPGFFYALLLALPYGGWRLGQRLWRGWREDRAGFAVTVRSLAVTLAVALAVTLALLLVVFAPTAQLTALSQRATRTTAYALSFPLPPAATLIGMWSPLSGQYDVYLGIAVLALALVALLVTPRADGDVPIVFAVTAVLFLVLSFGAAGHLLAPLVEHVPGFGLFRASNRYKLLAAPLLAVVAAHGAAALLGAARASRRRTVLALVALTVAVATVAAVAGHWPAVHVGHGFPGRLSTVVIALAAAVLAAAALLGPARLAPVLIVALAALAVYDPQRYVHARGEILEARPDHLEDLAKLDGLADVRHDWRVFDEFVLEQRPGPRLGIREFRGYPAGGSLEYQRYADVIALARRNPDILAAYNIRYVLWGKHHRVGLPSYVLKQPPDKNGSEFVRLRDKIYQAQHPAPAVAWYGAVSLVPGPGRAVVDAVLATLESDGVRRRVIIEDDGADALGPNLAALTAAAAQPPDPVEGQVVSERATESELTIDAPAAGVVVLAETMYPGWQATVDGVPARPFYVNRLLRGVAVTAGHHAIVWRFRPHGHGLRLAAFWLGLLVVITAATPPRVYMRKDYRVHPTPAAADHGEGSGDGPGSTDGDGQVA